MVALHLPLCRPVSLSLVPRVPLYSTAQLALGDVAAPPARLCTWGTCNEGHAICSSVHTNIPCVRASK